MSLPRPVRALMPAPGLGVYSGISLIDAIGTGLFLACSVIYFKEALSLTDHQIGVGLTTALIFGMLAPAGAGRLGDRFGHRKVLFVLNCALAAAFVALPLVTNFSQFLLVTSAIAFLEAGTIPPRRALLAIYVGPDARVRASAYNRALCNVGFAVGSGSAAATLAFWGDGALRVLIIANAVSFVGAAVLTALLPKAEAAPSGQAPVTESAAVTSGARQPVYRDRRFLVLSVLCGLIATHESILAVGLPLLVLHLDGPHWFVATILLINTVLTVALQVPASRGAESTAGGIRALIRSSAAVALCAWLLAGGDILGGTPAMAIIAVAILALTLGELWSSAGSWSVSFALSEGERQGEYLGVFTTIQHATAVVGPIVAAAAVVAGWGAWIVLGAAYLVVGALTHVVYRRHRLAPPQLAEAAKV